MSYSVNTPCWNCTKAPGNGGNCRDEQHILDGIIEKVYVGEEHQGSGQILVSCCNHDLPKQTPPDEE